MGTCLTKHGFMGDAWSGTGDAEPQTSASVKDAWRRPSLGTCASLGSTMIPFNVTHVFPNHYMEAEDNVPQILQERPAARWQL